MTLFLQRLFDALTNGAIYAALALALVLIHRSTGILNFAQGELAMLSTYVALVLVTPATPALAGTGLAADLLGTPWPVPLAILGAVAVSLVVGAALERTLVRPVEHQRSALAVVSITLAIFLAANSLAAEVWGTAFRPFPTPFPDDNDDFVGVGGARLWLDSLGVWLTLLAVLLALWVFLQRTRLGLAFRAVSSNRDSAELVGVDADRTLMLGWALAAALGAVAGALVAPTALLEPDMMQRLLVYSFAAAVLGGLDSPIGAIVGGMVVSITQTMLAGYVGPIGGEHDLIVAFLLIVAVLVLRPRGLLGRPASAVNP